jgi:hypothetical protein
MINVANRAHVHVRFGPLKLAFCHLISPKNNARAWFYVCTMLLVRFARVTKRRNVADTLHQRVEA